MSTPEIANAERLARIEVNIERLALALEKAVQDLEARTRALESALAHINGVRNLLAWLGPTTAAGLVIFVAQRG